MRDEDCWDCGAELEEDAVTGLCAECWAEMLDDEGETG